MFFRVFILFVNKCMLMHKSFSYALFPKRVCIFVPMTPLPVCKKILVLKILLLNYCMKGILAIFGVDFPQNSKLILGRIKNNNSKIRFDYLNILNDRKNIRRSLTLFKKYRNKIRFCQQKIGSDHMFTLPLIK